jgi:hypothetical protein
MQWSDILVRLNDLPATFTRKTPTGLPFAWWQNAATAGLYKYTNAADGLLQQADFSSAVGRYIDLFGDICNIPRHDLELDGAYFQRILFTIDLEGGSPTSIASFIQVSENAEATITENFSACSWSASIFSGGGNTSLQQVFKDLASVRPAGVPVNVSVNKGGLYLGTSNYIGKWRVTGSFLSAPVTPASLTLPSTTNNATPSLPTLFMSDPTINPSLAA